MLQDYLYEQTLIVIRCSHRVIGKIQRTCYGGIDPSEQHRLGHVHQISIQGLQGHQASVASQCWYTPSAHSFVPRDLLLMRARISQDEIEYSREQNAVYGHALF